MPAIYVAVGHYGVRLRSVDGQTWTDRAIGKEGEVFRAAAIGNGRAVAVGSFGGDNIMIASTDAVSWKQTKQDAKYAHYLRGLAFGREQFLGLGGDPGSVGNSKPFQMTSTDGQTWSAPTEILGKHILRRAVYGADRFAAVGDRGMRATTTDFKTWTVKSAPKATETFIDIAFGNSVFVGVGLHGLRMSSPDGLSWTDLAKGEEGEHLNTIVWAKSQFVAIGAGATYTSPDGKRWQRHPTTLAPTVAVYGSAGFVGSHWKGRILFSPDAISWREVHADEHHISAVAWGEV